MKHIDYALPVELHLPMYLMHMYWARKPWNVVRQYIETYSEKDETVLDPFAGSGVAPIEAISLGRKAIGIDLNPVATFISRNTAKPFNLEKYQEAFKEMKKSIFKDIKELYKTKCPIHQVVGMIHYTVWENEKPLEISYSCPACQKFKSRKRYKTKRPDKDDEKLINEIKHRESPFWYPKSELYYLDGRAFKEGTHIEGKDTVPDLFTRRNLIALSILHSEIEKIEDKEIKELMKFTFSSCIHLSSNMTPATKTKWGAGWTEPRLWIPSRHREYNVWELFENRHKQIFKGKREAKGRISTYKEAKSIEDITTGKANILWENGDALITLRKYDDNCIDYIFTDPTYGASIQYGELNFIWASWLGYNKDYIQSMKDDEVVINTEGQEKTFDDYYNMLYTIFKEVSRVLKPNKYMTVTFHNPSFSIRNALERAAYIAGFDLKNVVYQPPAKIGSSKSSLQPYGSVVGDFYFRFRNVKKPDRKIIEDEEVFERVVLDATIRIIANRGEPTPMPIISNGIEPALCEHGFPSSAEKTIEKVLIDHIGKDFVVQDRWGRKLGKIKDISDKILWLTERNIKKFVLDRIPLKDRIEDTTVGLLKRRRKLPFTEIEGELYTKFKNSLTPNPPSIRGLLENYAHHTKEGLWQLKQSIIERESLHPKMIGILAELGKRMGFKIWIGKKEQSDPYRNKRLSYFSTLGSQLNLPNISKSRLSRIEAIDVLWIKEREIKYSFEVENTTSITDAIVRSSNIPYKFQGVIVIPDERESLLYNRIKEPMLRRRIFSGKWKFILYDKLVEFYNKNIRKSRIPFDEFRSIMKLPQVDIQKKIEECWF
jgi:DNA modification methylase